MAPKSEDGWIDLIRDLIKTVQTNHIDLSNQIQEVKESIDGQINDLDRRITKHDHHFTTASKVMTFVLGGGLLGLIVGVVELLNYRK